jgi:hypothetical protein
MMGKLEKSSRFVRICAVGGSALWTRATAASTSWSVSSMLTRQLKNRFTSAEPRLVTERTFSRPGTVRTACSIGRVIATSICSIGVTPLSTPMMMRGKSVVGNTATGSVSASYTPITVRIPIRKMIDFECRANQ